MRGRPKSSNRPLVEDAIAVGVAAVTKANYSPQELAFSTFTISVQWNSGGTASTVVGLTRTRPNFGGVMYWFRCPECSRRCAKLYVLESRPVFACRSCHGLAYRLQYDKSPLGAYF